MPTHIRKGDMVMVTSGDDRRHIGEVLRVIPKHSQVVVRGANVQVKHLKPTRTAPQGGVVSKELPIHISKVSPVVDGKPCRVGFRTEKDGSKVRVARHKGQELKVLGTVRASKKK